MSGIPPPIFDGMLDLPPPIVDNLPPPISNNINSLRTFCEENDPHLQLEMLERLGKGSFGSVYKGKHIPTGTLIAVKKMLVEDIDECLSEIEIMKECSCPQVVDYFGHFMRDEHLWIIMEYCGLGALGDVMALCKRKTLGEAEIASILRNVLMGLDYMHSLGKIHRDIKPDNVLLNEKGECKLADFGVAGKSSTLEKRSTLTGTPYYIAPEVLKEDESGYDSRADIWSLGICALQLANGTVPYAELPPMKVMLYIANNPAPMLKGAENFSAAFNSFISQSLIKDPQMRASARLLLESEFIRKSANLSNEVTLSRLIKDGSAAIKASGGLENALKVLKGKPLQHSSSSGGSPLIRSSSSAGGSGHVSPPPASSNQYGATAAPSNQYGATAAPSNQYGAPSALYGAPANSNQYGAPANSNQYGAPPSQYGAVAFNPYAPNPTNGVVPARQNSNGSLNPGAINRRASGSYGALPGLSPPMTRASNAPPSPQVPRPSSPNILKMEDKPRNRSGSSPESVRKNNNVSSIVAAKNKPPEKKKVEIAESKARDEKPTIRRILQKFLISRPSEKDLAKKNILISTIYDDDYYGGKKGKKR